MERRWLFDFAANARQLGRGLVFERSVGLNLVAEPAQEFGEVDDLVRESAHAVPVGLHVRRGMQHDLAPLRRAVDDQDYVANLGGLEGGAGDARFLHQKIDIDQSGKIKASTNAAEFTNLAGQFLLALDPVVIGRRRKRGDALLSERRGGVSAQEFAQRFELEHARRTVEERTGHRNLWYRSRNIAGVMRTAKAEWTNLAV